MTPEQIVRFNREGYLLPPSHLLRRRGRLTFAGISTGGSRWYTAEGKDSYSISSAHLRHGRVWDVLTNPRVVAVVTDLLGPSAVGWGSHFFCKMPGDGKAVSWHQDASYWPLTPSKAVTVWLAIDDADRGNACMRYIPGTHVLGHLTWKLSETDESNVLNQTVPDVDRFGDPVDVQLKAGEASVHTDLLLHGSEANTSSPRRRCGRPCGTPRATCGRTSGGTRRAWWWPATRPRTGATAPGRRRNRAAEKRGAWNAERGTRDENRAGPLPFRTPRSAFRRSKVPRS